MSPKADTSQRAMEDLAGDGVTLLNDNFLRGVRRHLQSTQTLFSQ